MTREVGIMKDIICDPQANGPTTGGYGCISRYTKNAPLYVVTFRDLPIYVIMYSLRYGYNQHKNAPLYVVILRKLYTLVYQE